MVQKTGFIIIALLYIYLEIIIYNNDITYTQKYQKMKLKIVKNIFIFDFIMYGMPSGSLYFG